MRVLPGASFTGSVPVCLCSWNGFHCNINAELLKETADAVVALGLDKLGYRYVNADDCWALTRDANGTVHPDPSTFPLGFSVSAACERHHRMHCGSTFIIYRSV